MLNKVSAFVVIGAAVLLAGCTSTGNVIEDAKNLRAEAIARVDDIKSGVNNVINEIEGARAKLIEKKNQLERTVEDIRKTVDSINSLLGTVAPDEETTDAPTSAELLTQKEELEAAAAKLTDALAEINAAVETAELEAAEPIEPEDSADEPAAKAEAEPSSGEPENTEQ